MVAVQQVVHKQEIIQETEEQPIGDNALTDRCDFDCCTAQYIPPHHYSDMSKSYTFNIDLIYIQLSEKTPHNLSVEIETPPPDYNC